MIRVDVRIRGDGVDERDGMDPDDIDEDESARVNDERSRWC